MKKLFISCPVTGRTEENIQKSIDFMKIYAELVTGEEFEVLDSHVPGGEPGRKNGRVYALGESIKLMSEADYVVGIWADEGYFKECIIERHVANAYHIPFLEVPYHDVVDFKDVVDIERSLYEEPLARVPSDGCGE